MPQYQIQNSIAKSQPMVKHLNLKLPIFDKTTQINLWTFEYDSKHKTKFKNTTRSYWSHQNTVLGFILQKSTICQHNELMLINQESMGPNQPEIFLE